MNIKRVSLGFGLRVSPEDPANQFPENQRLVPLVHSPICADSGVWVETGDIERLTERLLPEFANPIRLAKSMDLLADACRKQGISITDLWPVCITASEASVITLVERFGPGYFEHQPSEEDLIVKGWRFLGFDAVDLRGMTSGLKGCGYIEPTWTKMGNLFGAGLNNVGLFSDHLMASDFAEARGMQIREHAPFVVVGILKGRRL